MSEEKANPKEEKPGKPEAAGEERGAEGASEKHRHEDEQTLDSIFLVPYPKIIFMYPTMFVALVAAVWLTILEAAGNYAPGPVSHALTTVFLGVFMVNLVVLTVDFPRATSLTLFFVGATLLLGGVILMILKPGILPVLKDIMSYVQPNANATFFWAVFGIFGIMLILVKIMVQFDYWEVRRNEILHHHGILSDLRRYPTAGIQIEKEINDVFEYILLRSGRLVLRPNDEKRAFVLDNVPFIGVKEEKITKMLSAIKVKMQVDN